jgi:hypothetical protein
MAEQLIGSPSDLSTAGQLGLGDQERELQQQTQTQNQIQQDTALPQQAAAGALGQKMDQITIDDNLAKGLTKMTGQDWSSSVGTKWRPDVFTALTTGMAQAKYRQDVLEGRVDLQKDKETFQKQKDDADNADKEKRASDAAIAAQKRTETTAGATKTAATTKAKGETDSAEIRANAAAANKAKAQDGSGAWFKKMQDSGKALVAAQQKKGGLPDTGLGADIKNKVFGQSSGDAAKIGSLKQMVQEYRTARDNYNKKAQAEGLTPQPADPAADAALDALTGQVQQQENLQKQPNATTNKLPGLE